MNDTPLISTPLQTPKKSNGRLLWFIIFIIMLLATFGWVGWQWGATVRHNTQLEKEKAQLQALVDTLTLKTVAAETDTKTDAETTPACDATVTTTLKDNIKAAVESKNYAALETSMSGTVRVILAASEGVGDRTPAQAVSDMAYLGTGTSPWDFNLPAATLAAYDAGDYADYFDTNTFVGKAANDLVVSFDFDDCGKINKIFMAADAGLL